MKNKASNFIKQVISVITAVAKAKTLALKHKTASLKTRIMIFSVLKNRKLLISSISNKLQALMGHNDDKNRDGDESEVEDQSKAIVIYNTLTRNSLPDPAHMKEFQDEYDDERYPDLTHSLFDMDEDFEDPGGSVIDIVKHSKEDGGEEFKLEDEIDQVADLFIKRFHRQMKMQKQKVSGNAPEFRITSLLILCTLPEPQNL